MTSAIPVQRSFSFLHLRDKYELTTDQFPVGLIAQLVRALHRYRRGHGFDSRSSLTGDSLSCTGGNAVYDNCDRKCMCYEGELLFCHRIRREFTAMNLEERQIFVQALRTAARSPVYRAEYRRLFIPLFMFVLATTC